MQLTGHESINNNLVKNHNSSCTRTSSYDLTVDTVIQDGVVFTRTKTIEPQHVFVVVCKEHVKVPDGHVAYIFPKTSLCQEGILSLSTGIIDTGYEGLISTSAINFGKEAFSVSPGKPFLRIVFHQLTGVQSTGNAAIVSDDNTYVQNRIEDSKQFPLTFMNIPAYFDKFSKEVKTMVYSDFSNKIVIAITILGFALAIIMGGLTWYQIVKVDTG
jgi:deoxycytidine triphosphate deaminase